MIFFESNQTTLEATKRNYKLSAPRLTWAILLVIVLIGLGFGSHVLNWDAGQSVFLSMAQTVFGVVMGILTGEGTASRELSNPGTS